MWIAQGPDSKPLTTLTFWLWVSLSALCVDGAAPAQARRIPIWIAQTIGIEALVGLWLAAGEAHTSFSLIPFAKGYEPVPCGVSSLDAFFIPAHH
jgi:hypothetical protein